jgi:hypothetical protein
MSQADMSSGERAYRSLKAADQIFVDKMAEGMAQGPAWTASGRTDNAAAARANATRAMLSNANIAEALSWRRGQAAEKAGLSIERCHEVLAAIIDSDPAEVAPWLRGEVEIEDIPERARLALLGLEETVTEGKYGTRMQRKFRREGKVPALRLTLEALGGLGKSPEGEQAEALQKIAELLGKKPEDLAE